ncbi:hypothetical protein E2986_00371 [Frieseomelitta varia]|uniref:PBZ-type domain-containing protein n=1 Tax=Frieseomelitta varia TaxID=561572 RepID=A0A833RDZ6_9HYME|nr:hypothetical protein E2986_00371 [Frieseomelitta varia]
MKKLQILCVDNDLVQRVDLQIGNNVIGRNVKTGCNDDQVIKHAAVINLISDNEMTITPIAPCYMKSIESSRWQLLKLGVTADEDIDSNTTNDKRFCSGEGDNSQSSCSALDKILNNNSDINKINVEKTVIDENNLLYNNDEDKIQDLNSTLMCEHHNIDQSSVIKEDYKVQNMNIKDNKPSTSEQILSLKENLDLPCTNEDNEIDTMVEDTQSYISNGQESETYNNTTINNFRRNKCKYGKKCYRKSSQHKNIFSHPGDSDYDISDNRQECPYGTRCYRKNPQHKIEFKHSDTNITNKRKKQNSKRTKVQESLDTLSGMEDSSVEESAEESVDESEYEPSDIETSDDNEMYSDKNESELENDIAD